MNIVFWIKLYVLTIPIFLIVDLIWLGYVAKGFYQKHLGFILGSSVNWKAAITFYLIYIMGILFFAVWPAIQKNSFAVAIGYGCLYGFFTYATYDLTNMATIEKWPLKIVVADILWGAVLCSTVAAMSFKITRLLNAS